ncbi:Hypothetical Protein FCC1311_032672 [Hondaea fermentalgiana]|uniref:Uncharacterized protein n=1 Tax=Hondaea fermentalgiana TaxID=2315210 RepID=A0A2R5GGQ8_9STRA|nr:Hypothetical Protein FCC1311_032672 [Hondaea fermentalgiana]|eukprot:GBG27044.1 Hypothetical Protein FCC1311_032672 [Hondaea fermentalgiana]
MFQDWTQDLNSQRLQSKLDEAAEVELEDLAEIEEDLEADVEEEDDGERENIDILRQVSDYARETLRDALGASQTYPPNAGSPPLKPLPVPAELRTSTPPIESLDSHVRKSDEAHPEAGAPKASSSEDPELGMPVEGKEHPSPAEALGGTKPMPEPGAAKPSPPNKGGIPALTRLQMILARDAIVAALALLLPFFPAIRDISQGSSILIPIFVLILALRPLNDTCIGVEVQQWLSFAFTWPFFYAWSVFMFVVATDNIGAFMFLLGLFLIFAMLVGLTNSYSTLCMVVESITYTLVHISAWRIYNFQNEPESEKFHLALAKLNGASFAIALPFFLHWFGAMAIFPWRAEVPARNALYSRYCSYAKMLRRLRPVYDRIAVYTLNPTAQTEAIGVPSDLLDALSEAREQEVASIPLAQKWMDSALMETRFRFRGEGMVYVERYERTLGVTRIARSAATDLLTKLQRTYARMRANPEEAARSLEAEKALFLEIEAAENENMEEGEKKRKEMERSRIPILVTQINLLLEMGAHRLAQLAAAPPRQRREFSEEERQALLLLRREQRFLDRLAKNLHGLALTWMRRFLRRHALQPPDASRPNHKAFFKRTKLAAYILVLLKLVSLHRKAWQELAAEPGADKRRWKREWRLTFPFPTKFLTVLPVVDRETFYTPLDGCLAVTEHGVSEFFSSRLWKVAFKFALGTTLLALPGVLESSYQWYSSVQLLNAVFTFQVILFKTQAGLVIERTIHRLVGLFLGYLVIGIAWELACIHGCASSGHKWILYAVELLSLAAYLWQKTKIPKHGYVGFAAFRTIVSLSVVFAESSDPDSVEIWQQGGFVLASSAVGAGVALVLALLLWPASGRSMIREALSEAYLDFIVLFETILTERYDKPDDMVRELANVTSFENRIARGLFGDMTPKLRSAELETMQHINFDAPHDLYLKAVISTRRIWHSLWKLHHLGGIYIYLRDKEGQTLVSMRPSTARDIFASNRWLTSAFAVIAARFGSKRRDAMPVLRPVAATPHVLEEILQDFLARAYSDDLFLGRVVASDDLSMMCNLPLLNDSLLDISYALDDLFTFMERFLRKPEYADRLRKAERTSFDLYNKKDA